MIMDSPSFKWADAYLTDVYASGNMSERRNSMENLDIKVKGNVLTITVDLSKQLGPSASGKSMVIASSRGNQPIPGTEAIAGINIYTKIPK